MQIHSSNLNVLLITQQLNPPLDIKQVSRITQRLNPPNHASYTSSINFIILILILYTTSVGQSDVKVSISFSSTPLHSQWNAEARVSFYSRSIIGYWRSENLDNEVIFFLKKMDGRMKCLFLTHRK